VEQLSGGVQYARSGVDAMLHGLYYSRPYGQVNALILIEC
jgi:hypothetical protein